MTNEEVKVLSAKRSRRSFLIAAIAAAGGYEFYRWVDRAPGEEMLQEPLRKALNLNAALSHDVFDERRWRRPTMSASPGICGSTATMG